MLESVKKSRGKKGKFLRWMRNSSQFLCRLRLSSLASSQVALDKADGPSRSEWEEPARKRSASNQPHHGKAPAELRGFGRGSTCLHHLEKKQFRISWQVGWMMDGWMNGWMEEWLDG